MSKKLQNIKAVKQMLEGNHAFQTKKTHGFTDAKQKAELNKKHEVGDIWEETNANGTVYVIEQKNGFRVKKPKNSISADIKKYLNSFPNCPKDTCTCKTPNRLDNKMRVYHGKCFDCVIEMEHQLRIEGKYDEYEKNRIKNNAVAWIKKAEDDVNMLKKAYTEASTLVTNADGLTETWAAKMTPDEFEEKVQEQFNEFKKEFLENLNKEENEDD